MWLLWWMFLMMFGADEIKLYRMTGLAQGTSYSISYLSEDSVITQHAVDRIFREVDASLSLYQEQSLISRFNREGSVRMDTHMQQVVQAALAVHQASGGSFDITVRNLVLYWKKDKATTALSFKKSKQLTGSGWLQVKGDHLLALKPGVQIDCNGIAQGYTVDLLHDYITSKGITNLMVEVGGEIRVSGHSEGGREWRIGIESPANIGRSFYPVDKVISLKDKSVTTSGNYRQAQHLIDPQSGKPVQNGMVSVTVVASDAMTADAWDNAFFVMGWKKALAHAGRDSSLQVYMVYRDKQGNYRDTSSPGFRQLLR